jgi:hypothetical protein
MSDKIVQTPHYRRIISSLSPHLSQLASDFAAHFAATA